MKRLVMMSLACAALACAGAARAQGDLPETPAKLALAREVFQTANLPQMMEGVMGMTAGMQQAMTSKSTPEQQQKLAAFQRATEAEMKEEFVPKLIDQMAHVYARTFTDTELKDILAFYHSPSGQSMLAKTPGMMRSFSPQVMSDLPVFMRGTFARFCAATTCTADDRAAIDKMLASFPAAK